MLLYKAIVANPLLAKASIVLFLNKIDVFKSKLASVTSGSKRDCT